MAPDTIQCLRLILVSLMMTVVTSAVTSVKLAVCMSPCLWDQKMLALDCTGAGCSALPSRYSDLPSGIRPLDLTFGRNGLTRIPYLELYDVVTLDLCNNHIATIEPQAFKEMAHLEALLLSNNNISRLTSAHLFGLHKLTQLNLNGNRLTSLGPGVFYPNMHHSLKHLDLSENALSALDHNALNDLRVLEYLSLDYNYIGSLEPLHLAGLRNLQVLKLNNNPLQVLKNKTFASLEKLTDLFLDSTQLREIQRLAFHGLSQLELLDLQGNQLREVQYSLQSLTSLRILNLNNNTMRSIGTSNFPTSLEQVSISACDQLSKIDASAFLGLKNLKAVYITANRRLGYIAPNAFDMEAKIEELILDGNALSTISKGLVAWQHLERLDLSDNPWRCDCRLEWVAESSLPRSTKEALICASPSYLSGRRVVDLGFSQFVCHSYITIHSRVAMTLIAIATLALLVTLCWLCHRWRRQLLPCCISSKVRYVALFNVNDGEDDSVTIYPDSDSYQGSSIVRNRKVKLPRPVAV